MRCKFTLKHLQNRHLIGPLQTKLKGAAALRKHVNTKHVYVSTVPVVDVLKRRKEPLKL